MKFKDDIEKNIFGLFDVVLSVQKYQNKKFAPEINFNDLLEKIKLDGKMALELEIGHFMSKQVRTYMIKTFCDRHQLNFDKNDVQRLTPGYLDNTDDEIWALYNKYGTYFYNKLKHNISLD